MEPHSYRPAAHMWKQRNVSNLLSKRKPWCSCAEVLVIRHPEAWDCERRKGCLGSRSAFSFLLSAMYEARLHFSMRFWELSPYYELPNFIEVSWSGLVVRIVYSC